VITTSMQLKAINQELVRQRQRPNRNTEKTLKTLTFAENTLTFAHFR